MMLGTDRSLSYCTEFRIFVDNHLPGINDTQIVAGKTKKPAPTPLKVR